MARRQELIVAFLVLVLAIGGAGAGFVNGDAAVYAVQGGEADLSQRVVHLGYLLLAVGLAPLVGDGLPVALDVLTALSAAAGVVAVGRLARARALPVLPAALVFGAAVLPVASFAEVDVPWAALALWSAAVGDRRLAGLLLALAVFVSPTALLASPLVAWLRRDATVLLGAALAVALLTAGSAGAWWWGDRGVWSGLGPRPGRALRAWWEALGPGLLLALGGGGGVGLPLLLGPADAPTWLPVAAPAGLGLSRLWRAVTGRVHLLLGGLLVAALALSAVRQVRAVERVRGETAAIQALLERMDPADGLVAPWTWGARASVLATGDAYALSWRVPGEPVRDQARFCGREHRRIWTLPPGVRFGEGAWREEAGLAWAPAIHGLPGCP